MYQYDNIPSLRAILYIRGELNSAAVNVTSCDFLEVAGVSAIGQTLREHGLTAAECLFLADTDIAVAAAKRLGIAVAAYVNPEIPGQTYYGAQILIEGFDEVDEAFLCRIFQRHHNIPWTIAVTQRCIIREFAMEDLAELVSLYDQPGITYRIGADGTRQPGYIEPLYPIDEERAYQENYIRHMYHYYGYGMWLVIDQKSGMLIGRAGIEHREYGGEVELELGYLIHPDWQRRGIATEVCRAIIDYMRREHDWTRLNLLTEKENTASVALARKLGFSYVEDTDVSGSLTRRYVLKNL